jgi:hypothetical protein
VEAARSFTKGDTMEAVEKIEHKGKVIEIHYDQDPQSPRVDCDNLGTILYTSTRYNLGDKQVSREEIKDIAESKDVIAIPVYAYIHSGIALNTTGFSCPWDSGQCGIIYADKEKIRKEYGVKRIGPAVRRKVEALFKAEVEEFGKYLGGEVYGYQIKDKDRNDLDSCWGYIGLEWAIQAAKEAC